MEEKNIKEREVSLDDLLEKITDDSIKNHRKGKFCLDDSEFDDEEIDDEEIERYQNKDKISKFELYKTKRDTDK